MRDKCRIFLLFCFSLCEVVEIQGDYKLEIKLDDYKNPSHRQADGICCHRHYSSRQCSACNNRFTFCVLQSVGTELGSSDLDVCGSMPSYVTGVVGGLTGDPDNLSFEERGYIDRQNNITNPLVFTGNGSWPGSFMLVVKIKNRLQWSIFYEYPVDLIIEDWELPINKTQRRQLTGLKGRATLTMSALVTCTNGLLCQNCTKICGAQRLGDSPGITDETSNNANTPQVGEELLQGTNDTIDAASTITGNSNNQLTIGLSVVLVIVLILVALIVIAIVYLMRRRWMSSSKRAEQQPSLHNQAAPTNDPTRYQSTSGLPAADEEDDADEGFTLYNPTYGTSNVYQRLPTEDSSLYEELSANGRSQQHHHQPDLIQTGQSQGDTHSAATGMQAGPLLNISSKYSIIMRQDLDISPAQSLDDMQEASDEDEVQVGGAGAPVVSGYNVIRKEYMDGYVSETASEEESREEEEEREGDMMEIRNDYLGDEVNSGEEHNRPRMPTPSN